MNTDHNFVVALHYQLSDADLNLAQVMLMETFNGVEMREGMELQSSTSSV